jgi:16S rRNA (uracil1498-N3)-methyltransferase
MSRRRFFVDQIHKQQAEIAGDEAHHLVRVLRVEAGEQYEITDGNDIFLAQVTEARKSRVVFAAKERVEPKPERLRLTLYVAVVKFERMEWIFEKGTELGVARFVPVIADRSEKGLERAVPKRMERWQRIALEASQQSRRDHLPVITGCVTFRGAVAEAPGLRLFADEDGGPPLLTALPTSPHQGAEVSVLLGPEGGWTGAERSLALEQGWKLVSLGPLVLRAETAAMSVAAVLQAHWLRFSGPADTTELGRPVSLGH